MNLHITLAGINHHTAQVDIRERYALSNSCLLNTPVNAIDERIQESLVLSTCNRVEIIGIGTEKLEEPLLTLWAKLCGSSLEDIRSNVYIYNNIDAVRHVFEVASSLDSMIIGEPQILGQLKKAYKEAIEKHTVGSFLNHLMHHAFSVAKRVRSETAIASNAVSISYAAVELAKRIFGNLRGHKALLLGAGEMAELASLHLLQNGIDEIIVANRTYENGQILAQKFHGHAIHFEDMVKVLPSVDIVIASTGSKEPILDKTQIQKALTRRKNQPIFLIDIAVPRDIDPAVNTLDNVYLYDIDDLKDIVEENLVVRKEEASRGHKIVDEELQRFQLWMDNLNVKPTIMDLVKRGETIANQELAKTLKHLGPIDPATKEALQIMVHSIAKKMNHDPITFLKKQGMNTEDPLARIHMTRRIFNLDNSLDQK